MIAVDTNVLVYAFRSSSPQHEVAREHLLSFAEGMSPWALPTQTITEFLRVTTFPRKGAASSAAALSFLQVLIDAPSTRVIAPSVDHWMILRSIMDRSDARGNLVHDAALVAVCVEHGVETLLSEDRGLRRFDDIAVIGLHRGVHERAASYRARRPRRTTIGARG